MPKLPQKASPSFAFSTMRRCLFEGIAGRSLNREDYEATSRFFENRCAYCGGDFQRWDHLVPVFEGGDTIVGNLVPACSKCDSSKGNRIYSEWMLSDVPSSPQMRGVLEVQARIEKIQKYVTKHGYQERKPEVRLNEAELQRYTTIVQTMETLQQEIEDFFTLYNERIDSGHIAD
jgi:hypothetical protein